MRNNNKKAIIFLPLLISVAIVVSFLIGRRTFYNDFSSQSFGAFSNISNTKIGEILNLINTHYVDSIDVDTLTEEYIKNILHKLDPHSDYISAVHAKASTERLDGEFDGIGVMFNMATDTVIIQNVIPGGPADKVGVQGGDRIMMIGDSLIAGVKMDQNLVVKKLKGPRGSIVKISVERIGADKLIDFNIPRDKIAIKSIEVAYMVAPEVGYIKLLQFSKTTHTEFVAAVERLTAEGMNKLIFDLTANGGGHLYQAILIANEFLPEGKMIVYTQGRNSKLAEQFSDGSGKFQSQELVVMIDENSASSSEIVAGALQDNDRGTIVGRRSFGKGLVQQQIPFVDGSLLNLTIARYHTPTGRSIQRSYDKGYDQYYIDFYKRYSDDELVNPDSVKMIDSLKYTTPKGKTVYGGGGIMPDVFVPIDTTLISKDVRAILINSTLFKYSLRYSDLNRKKISDITSLDTLTLFLDGQDDYIYRDFVKFAKSEGRDVRLSKSDKELALTYIKAYVARNSGVSDIGFYHYFNKFDNIFTKSFELLSQN